jgi:class 3 adenylate cyclase
VLVTESVREKCDPRFRLRGMPAVEVKGLPEPIVAYMVEGFDA